MQHRTYTYWTCLLRNSLSTISQTKQAHAQIVTTGYLPNVTLGTDLILSYARCGSVRDARKVFDKMSERNMHSWNILISSYVQKTMYFDAVTVFGEFIDTGLRPDHYTLPPLFKGAAGSGDVWLGNLVHGLVVKLGFEGYVVVGSSLLDFLVKCGNVNDGWKVFCGMSWKDTVVWNSMISGFGKAGCYVMALDCFKGMLREGVKPDCMTIPCVLSACGGEGYLNRGKEIHDQVVKSLALSGDVAIGNALIDMYAKCGCMRDSEKVFNTMRESNLVTWTTMISCCGVHGKGEESLVLFEKMRNFGLKPNSVTFTAVLASCSHSGLLDQGRKFFNSIESDYGLEPSIEHYACMVDLLGRCGHLDEALRIIKNMKFAATASVWGALLSGCVIHRNVDIGEIAAYHLFKLEPRNSSNYIALCSIYESRSIWDGVSNTRSKMRRLGLERVPGHSWIIIGRKVHVFYRGDLSHPESDMIHETLDKILIELMPYLCRGKQL